MQYNVAGHSAETKRSLVWDRVRTSELRYPLFAFLLSRLIVFFGGYLAAVAIPGVEGDGLYHVMPDNLFFDIWARWDSAFYMRIVEQGYSFSPGEMGPAAFFPLYPLLTKGMAALTGNILIAGVLVSHLALLGALIFLYKLTKLEFGTHAAQRAVIYIAAFPTAFFFSAFYTESLFLFTTVGAFYFARKRAWAWATLFALLAGATRIVGLAAWGVVGLEWMRSHGWTLSTMLRKSAWQGLWRGLRSDFMSLALILTAPFGFLSHSFFLYRQFGDPLAFWSVQSAWGREDRGFVAVILGDVIPLLQQDFGSGTIWWHVIIDLSAFFFALACIVILWRRLGEGYAIYTLLNILIPANSGSQSLSRYVLVLFPVFMLLALWGKRDTVDRTVTFLFCTLLGILTAAFVNWVFVA